MRPKEPLTVKITNAIVRSYPLNIRLANCTNASQKVYKCIANHRTNIRTGRVRTVVPLKEKIRKTVKGSFNLSNDSINRITDKIYNTASKHYAYRNQRIATI